jgi:diguanylate cyclase (GGDEF)-like protein/PAS domain S-box-containing protein
MSTAKHSPPTPLDLSELELGAPPGGELLALQLAICARIAQQPPPEELFPAVLELIGTRQGWDLVAASWNEPSGGASWRRPGADGVPAHPSASIPLMSAGVEEGVIALHSNGRRQFDEQSRACLLSIGVQLGHYLDNRRTHELLRRSDRALAAAANGVVIADATRPGFPLVYANAGFERLTGYSPAEVVGRSCSILQGPDTDPVAVAEFAEALARGREATVVLRNYRKDGSEFWNEVVLSPVYEDGRLSQYIGLQYDVTERREAEQRVWYLAYHDPLTGLANRAMLAKHIDRALDRARDAEREVALLFLDLDDFKVINDGLGHATGDEVLRRVADVLRAVARATDLLVRQGGDEFLVLLADVDGDAEAAATRLAEEIGMALREPLRVGDLEIPLRASLGISVFPRDAADAEALLKNSDQSMYRAKRSGGGAHRVYQRSRSSDQARVVATGGSAPAASEPESAPDLSEALALGGVRSVFQPIVDLTTREPVAYEALARGPEGSALERPDLLFRAARGAGRLGELDWACRLAAVRGGRAAGLTASRALFVNVEPDALDAPCPAALADDWSQAAHELRPVLEITERALTAQPAELLRAAREVRERGWALALDDVGADTRSLALMPLLRPDVIKLDLRLVQEQPGAEVAEIVNAVNAERERTGALILAEGIETEQHLEAALSLGATLGQGWLFGRPGALDSPSVPGLGLAGAPALDVDAPTPYATVESARPTRPGGKRLLLALSMQLEQQAMALGSGAVVISAFQSAERFTARTRRRYTALAADAAFVGALGVGMEAEPAPGVRGATLPDDDPLLGEWSIAVLGPHFAGALVALDRGDGGPEMERSFDFALTYDRDLVIAAANSLLTRVLAH